MRSEQQRLNHEQENMRDRVKVRRAVGGECLPGVWVFVFVCASVSVCVNERGPV